MHKYILSAGTLLLVLLLVSPASAQTQLAIEGTAGSFSQAFYPYNPDWVDGNPAISWQKFNVPAPGAFTCNFATQGEVAMQVTWTAPAGQSFAWSAPAGFQTQLRFDFRTGYGWMGAGSYGAATVVATFEDLTGSLGSQTTSMTLTGPGGDIIAASLSGSIAPGETVSFSALTLTWTVPAGYNCAFTNVPISHFYIEGMASADANLPDPGTWATVTAIPEPALCSALLGLMMLVGISSRGKSRRTR